MSGEAYRRRLRALLRLAGVRAAADLTFFEAAFVHGSYARERGGLSNDRLEFLGDSVLGTVAAGWLFERFPEEPEGLLTLRKAAMVNDASLAQTARRLQLSELIRLGAGMRASGGSENTSVLADAFEAFVGALFVRLGIERARRFVVEQHIERLEHLPSAPLDAKTRLQHYAQEHLAATPVYSETDGGTPQRPSFDSQVSVAGRTLGSGNGPSKKAAQQAAAEAALAVLEPPPA